MLVTEGSTCALRLSSIVTCASLSFPAVHRVLCSLKQLLMSFSNQNPCTQPLLASILLKRKWPAIAHHRSLKAEAEALPILEPLMARRLEALHMHRRASGKRKLKLRRSLPTAFILRDRTRLREATVVAGAPLARHLAIITQAQEMLSCTDASTIAGLLFRSNARPRAHHLATLPTPTPTCFKVRVQAMVLWSRPRPRGQPSRA
ncbi:hypothetical protein K437DRAFT_160995 [Tilletiaria anomala UBC 951]|uniref:Uncharacterized protein n=1 Tax=Tilletiaria anomala (strain ATCC 24038 / CBS 436.72 / UBC 951) TaxID=1037660 RepID=A0A066VQH6_TILAU|nr:uncharacterized protein K437DRAFT_160995 [Tilletiaria anomala UBC 951]KDN42523.1 hypothetical protein K437DRAFT_160995 [Tilletiaria anomala UBC 951]